MWVNLEATPTSAATGYIFDTRETGTGYFYWAATGWSVAPGTTIYVNGAAVTDPATLSLLGNRWYHIVAVLPLGISSPITIGARYSLDERTKMQVGLVSSYATALTAAKISELYNAYLGIPNEQIVEPTGLVVRDALTETVKIYAYDWSTVASG